MLAACAIASSMPPISSTKPISLALVAIQTLPPAISLISSYDLDLDSATTLINRSYASAPQRANLYPNHRQRLGSDPGHRALTYTPSKFIPM